MRPALGLLLGTVAVRAAVAELQAGLADQAARKLAITAELSSIATGERRLLDALVEGDGDATAAAIRGRLREERARRDALTAELARLEAAPTVDVAALVRDVTARAQDARALLGRHVPQARQMLRRLLEGRLVCEPFEDGGARGYAFSATDHRLGVPVLEAVNVGGGPNGIRAPLERASPWDRATAGGLVWTGSRARHAPGRARA